MPARFMQRYQRTILTCLRSEGALLPLDFLQRVVNRDPSIVGLTAEAYHYDGEQLNEVINRSWSHLLNIWRGFDAARIRIMEGDSDTLLTRERWLLPLFSELGYGRLQPSKPLEMDGKRYPVSHIWNMLPIHMVGCRAGIDEYTRMRASTFRGSPHGLVQELLNHFDGYTWAIASNGLRLRILRSNLRLTHQTYIEFDLETMMGGEIYTDFVLFWLLLHQSRFEGERPADYWLEKWSRTAHEHGIRALDQLRGGVEAAISALGKGFLACRTNRVLCEKLRSGTLSTQDYYRQVLRLVYRLLVLFVAEDRDILLHPEADPTIRQRYTDYYSTARLRHLARNRIGTRHTDLFQGLHLVMDKLSQPLGCPELGLPALNGSLFSREYTSDLEGCDISNHDLLEAVRALAFIWERGTLHVVDYKNMGPEELGSVYESLLELHPEVSIDAPTFTLTTERGNGRKTSGTYYTPSNLVNCLLDSALEPVLTEACAKPDPEQAILNLKICDPACGSGHFLIAAAHRLAHRLAAIRARDEEPDPFRYRQALRDVIRECIYGVDINPLAVELCRASLAMEAIVPGKPLAYLDHNFQCGNSLFGTAPKLINEGIPDDAFEPITGDNGKLCGEYRRRNKEGRKGQLHLQFDRLDKIVIEAEKLKHINDGTFEGVHQIKAIREEILNSPQYQYYQLLADAWCAAFVWKKVKIPSTSAAIPITEGILRSIRDTGKLPSDMYKELKRLAGSGGYHFFHWYLAFYNIFRVPPQDEEPEHANTGWSGGFDVVLSNPPWERIKIQEQEWFAVSRPDIAHASNAAERRKMIVDLAREDPALSTAFSEAHRKFEGESHFIRHSGRYPLCGRGDINTYAVFAETMQQIVKPTGRIGCIVPTGIATGDTTKTFFQNIMNMHTLTSLYDFENREKIFPAVDSRQNYCLLTLTGSVKPSSEAEFAFFLHTVEELQNTDRRFTLSAKDLMLLNPNTRTCPIFRSTQDAELTKRIYSRVPVLVNEEGIPKINPWGIRFSSMFHMANDSHLFKTLEQLKADNWQLKGNSFYKKNEVYLPLYEGKMISHFDHRFKSYQRGQTNEVYELNTQQHNNPALLALPRYWIQMTQTLKRFESNRKVLFAFRDVARSTDIRTAIFSFLPVVPSGHTLAIISFENKYAHEMLCFAACVSSFVFDYVARQKIGGIHMIFSVLKQLPVLPPSEYILACRWYPQVTLSQWISPRALELTYTAWDLAPFAQDCGYNGSPFCWDEQRRFLLRCELDAAYFHLYGIARDDVDYIMETFPIVKKDDEKQFGEYRTKRVILELFDQMQCATETGKPFRTVLDPPPAHPSAAHNIPPYYASDAEQTA